MQNNQLIPKNLYQYVRPYPDYFKAPTIRFTPINELNDPYEFHPAVIFPPEYIEQYKKRVDRTLGDSAIKAILANIAHKEVTKLLEKRGYGVACLTECDNDFLMWSHYSQGHTGSRIAFNTDHDFFKAFIEKGLFASVNYCDSRVAVNFDDFTYSDLLPAMFTKRSAWRDEKEWRIVMPRANYYNELGKPGIAFLPPECITSIVLGVKASPNIILEAEEYVKLHKHIQLNFAKFHHEDFKIDYVNKVANIIFYETFSRVLFPGSFG